MRSEQKKKNRLLLWRSAHLSVLTSPSLEVWKQLRPCLKKLPLPAAYTETHVLDLWQVWDLASMTQLSGQKNSWIWVKQFCFKFQMKLFQLHYSSSKTKPATAKNDSVDKFLNGQKREHLSLTRDLQNRASFHQRQTVLQSVTDFALFRANGLLM